MGMYRCTEIGFVDVLVIVFVPALEGAKFPRREANLCTERMCGYQILFYVAIIITQPIFDCFHAIMHHLFIKYQSLAEYALYADTSSFFAYLYTDAESSYPLWTWWSVGDSSLFKRFPLYSRDCLLEHMGGKRAP